jgi:PAS domain-containing protein
MPVFLVGADGAMLYYNDAAESIIGMRFDETGMVPMEVWSQAVAWLDQDGEPLGPDASPAVRALQEWRPVHSSLVMRGIDGIERPVTGTSIPLESGQGRPLGVLTLFWESKE